MLLLTYCPAERPETVLPTGVLRHRGVAAKCTIPVLDEVHQPLAQETVHDTEQDRRQQQNRTAEAVQPSATRLRAVPAAGGCSVLQHHVEDAQRDRCNCYKIRLECPN